MPFVKNNWYLAAWSDELPEDGRLARTIIGDPVVFWRADGVVHAVVDQCAHRLAPLHLGKIEGKTIRCGYHGLAFDGATGQCIDNPHGPVTSALYVRSYPTVERYKGIWIWTGEKDAADPGLIVDLQFLDSAPEHAFSKGYIYTAAGHKLLEDNILDLSHTDYLHPTTLGGGAISRTKAKVEKEADKVSVKWLCTDRPPPFLQQEFGGADDPVDLWTEVCWHPNGVMPLVAGATRAGCALEEGFNTLNVHIMTPESDTTTHYFYANTRTYRIDDVAYNAAVTATLRAAFEGEDKPMIEGQQRALGDADLFEKYPALLPIDNGSTRARRLYERLLTAES